MSTRSQWAAAVVLGLTVWACWGIALGAPPNIIVILVDDMGWSDLGCYGSEIPTPHLDALAKNGLRFTQFYNTGRCCPTRAALLTGLYSHQTGVGHMVEDRKSPGYRGRLNDQCRTIGELLQPAGYFTAFSGKWHVGQNHGVTPSNRGFERSLNAAAGGFYYAASDRAKLFLDGKELDNTDPQLGKDWYTTDLWTRFGLKFIDEAIAAKRPFYLHLCHNAPHFPLQVPADEIARFRGKYKAGWDETSKGRYRKQLELGLIDKSWLQSARPTEVKSWEEFKPEEQDRFDHIMATYAAVVHRMDRSVGDLVKGLQERGVLDETLILFLSDNGGNAEAGPQGRTNGDPTTGTSNWYCGMGWAYAQNTPFRLFKHFNHEGGISSPLIAHWPKGISVKGELRQQPAHLIDVVPTCLELAGASYPKEANGQAILPLEGRSLVPAFTNLPIEREALYWEHDGNAAVRVGDWKLVRQGRKGAWELYDLKADRTEQRNLAEKFPERVAELADRWTAWAERTHVLPEPNPQGKGKNAKKSKRKE